MYAFVVGMERCGTHSAFNIIKHACCVPSHIVHEEKPYLCHEAKLVYEDKDFRTKDLEKKIFNYRLNHKNNQLVFEANHRLGFFVSTLMRELGPNCKFILMARNPLKTLISRIAIWNYYTNFIDKYPDFFLNIAKDKGGEFNKFRINPPKTMGGSQLAELYAWEWLEIYKITREQLHGLPKYNRKFILCDELTTNYQEILKFIGLQYFEINDKVIGWAGLKADSIYPQKKQNQTDIFVTNNRDPDSDETILFAKKEIYENKDRILEIFHSEFVKFPFIDEEVDRIEKLLIKSFSEKVIL